MIRISILPRIVETKSGGYLMKLITLTLLLSFSLTAVADCPKERWERKNCQFEQAAVEQALIGASIDRVFSYCRLDTPGSDESEALQCRGPAIYKNTYGLFNDNVFEDRFVASEVNRFRAFQIYFVKQENGKYNIYLDSTADGVLNIDTHLGAQWRDIEVNFDSDLRPQWTSLVIDDATGELVPGGQFIHTPYWADIRFPNGDVTRYYTINGPQRSIQVEERHMSRF